MSETRYWNYGAEQTAWLAGRDPKLGAYIAKRGHIQRETRPDAFAGIIYAIIGQQISSKAQKSIWCRFREKFAPCLPDTLALASPEVLRSCGVSARKADYIIRLAREFARGSLSHATLAQLEDRELEEKLVALPGIGKWTAEMLLIFTFQRPNVLSYGDLAIRRGMCNLYGYAEISREVFERHFLTYSPWATVASLYLWDASVNLRANS